MPSTPKSRFNFVVGGGSMSVMNLESDNMAPAEAPRAARSETLSDLGVFRPLLFIYLASVLIRVILNPMVQGLTIYTDEWLYIEAARSILGMKGTYWSQTFTGLPAFLYPLVMAPVVVNLSWEQAHELIRAINAIMISLVVFPAYGLAREWLGRRQGLAVAGLVALLPAMGYCAKTMAENVFFPLFVVALWLAMRAIVRPSIGRCLSAGLAAGFAFHAKPQALALPIIIALTVVLLESGALCAIGGASLPRRLTGFGKRVGIHAFTALGWVIGISPRPAAAMWLEGLESPMFAEGFLGFYHKVAFAKVPLEAIPFLQGALNNIGGWIVAAGFLPAWALALGVRDCLRGRTAGRAENACILFTLSTVLVFLWLSARHVVKMSEGLIVKERFFFVVLPLLITYFFVYFSRARPAEPARFHAIFNRMTVAVIGALFYLLTVHLSLWHLTSDTPSFAGGLMLARLGETPRGWIAVYLLSGLSALTLFLLAGASLRLNAWALAALFVFYNVGWYGAHDGVVSRHAWRENDVARRVGRLLTKDDRLMVLRDGLDVGIARQVGYACPGTAVLIAPDAGVWYGEPLGLEEDGTVDSHHETERSWLLASNKWIFSREPELTVDECGLYRLGGEEPLRMLPAQVAAYRDNPLLLDEIDPKLYLDQLKLTYIETRLPAVWMAGQVHPVHILLRSERALLLSQRDLRLALGYQWSKPELTPNEDATPWDEGRHSLFPKQFGRGEAITFELEVLAPESADDSWLLTFKPLLIADRRRIYAERDELEESHRIEVRPSPASTSRTRPSDGQASP